MILATGRRSEIWIIPTGADRCWVITDTENEWGASDRFFFVYAKFSVNVHQSEYKKPRGESVTLSGSVIDVVVVVWTVLWLCEERVEKQPVILGSAQEYLESRRKSRRF